MTRKRQVLFWVVALIAILGAYAWFFGVSTMLAIEVRYFARKTPIMYEVPSPLSTLDATKSNGTRLQYFDYSFEVPWGDVDQTKSKLMDHRVLIGFGSGKALMVTQTPPQSHVKSLSSMLDERSLKAVYGADALQSDYAFASSMLNATPRQIGPLTPRPIAVRTSMLLITKGIVIPTDSGIYLVQCKDVKGFQYGTPGKSKKIVVELYSENGGLEFRFHGKDSAEFTQEDINRVLQTLQVVGRQTVIGQ